jgi:hypothetical protein
MGQEELQRALRERIANRMRAQADTMQSSITTLDAPPPAESDQGTSESSSKPTEPAEDRFTERPVVDERFVFTGVKTTQTLPDQVILAPANVLHPNQADGQPVVGDQNLAEDGLWVPDLPYIKRENFCRLECRLEWQDPPREIYFGADYSMNVDTPPLSQIPPPFPVEPTQHEGNSELIYRPAIRWGVEDVTISRTLKIEVSWVRFLVHALSNDEDILVGRLDQLHEAHARSEDFSRAAYYEERINAMVADMPTDADPDAVAFFTRLKEFYELRDMEEHNSRLIREALIQTWNALRDARGSGPTRLPRALQWRSRKCTPEETERETEEHARAIQTRAEAEARLHALTHEGEQIDIHAKIQELENNHTDLGLRRPGEPRWKPVLTTKAEVTPTDQCSPEEQVRRTAIEGAQVFVTYVIDGIPRGRTEHTSLDANFKADVRGGMVLHTTQFPQKVSLELSECGSIKERVLASVTLPVTIGEPPERPYEFTSEFMNPDGNLIMGTITARSYIEATADTDIMIRPPDAQAQKTRRRLAADPSSFLSVNKLREWAEKHDPNDPYLAAVLSSDAVHRNAQRLGKKFQLDPDLDASTFASLMPTWVGQQLQEHMERIRQQDEEAR